jgi:hypothetical protein
MNPNDLRIKELQQKVQEQEANLSEKQKYRYVTNSVLNLDGTTYNLHVLNLPSLLDLTAKLFNYEASFTKAKEYLELTDYASNIDGYSIEEWLQDIKTRVELLKWQIKKDNLRSAKERLKQLLSEEAKVADTLDRIAKEIF